MTTASPSFFDSTVLLRPDTFLNPSPTARVARPAPARIAPEAPASLWRQTVLESATERRYRRVEQIVFGLLSVLGLGGIAYAAYATWALVI